RTGASYEPTYDIELANGELVTRTLDVVLLVPQPFTAPPLSDGVRSERLADSTLDPQAASNSRGGAAPFLLILLAIGAAAAVYFLFLKNRSGGSDAVLTVNKNRFY